MNIVAIGLLLLQAMQANFIFIETMALKVDSGLEYQFSPFLWMHIVTLNRVVISNLSLKMKLQHR